MLDGSRKPSVKGSPALLQSKRPLPAARVPNLRLPFRDVGNFRWESWILFLERALRAWADALARRARDRLCDFGRYEAATLRAHLPECPRSIGKGSAVPTGPSCAAPRSHPS